MDAINEIYGDMRIKCQYHVLMEIDELNRMRYPNNPNKHSPDQIKTLAKIMRGNSVRHPIVVSSLTKRITKGHGRLEAAMLNKWTHFPVQFQDYESEASEFQDVVADNALAQASELSLKQINEDLATFGPELDIELLGIKDFTLDASEREKTPRYCPHCQGEL